MKKQVTMRIVLLLNLLMVAATLSASEPKSAAEAMQKGKACFDKGDYDGAVAAYTEAIKLDPKSAEAFSGRGITYAVKGDPDHAITDFTDSIRLKPDAAMYSNRATAYGQKEKHDKAIADYTTAIKLDPNCVEAYFGRGLSYGILGKLNEAAGDLTAAIQIKPDAVLYANRGVAYGLQGEHSKAIADFAEAARLDPANAHPHNDLAWLLATCPDDRLRDGKRAVELATRACELTQWKDCGCVDTLAAAYAAVGKFDKAVEFEQMALKAATNDAKKRAYRDHLDLYKQGKPYREAKPK